MLYVSMFVWTGDYKIVYEEHYGVDKGAAPHCRVQEALYNVYNLTFIMQSSR